MVFRLDLDDSLAGLDVEPGNIFPGLNSCLRSLAASLKHRRPFDAWLFDRSAHRGGLDPGGFFFDLQQQAGDDHQQQWHSGQEGAPAMELARPFVQELVHLNSRFGKQAARL